MSAPVRESPTAKTLRSIATQLMRVAGEVEFNGMTDEQAAGWIEALASELENLRSTVERDHRPTTEGSSPDPTVGLERS